jgi:hypothetical protein
LDELDGCALYGRPDPIVPDPSLDRFAPECGGTLVHPCLGFSRHPREEGFSTSGEHIKRFLIFLG